MNFKDKDLMMRIVKEHQTHTTLLYGLVALYSKYWSVLKFHHPMFIQLNTF